MVADDPAGDREPRSMATDPLWTPITREDVLFILAQLGDGTDPRIARLYDALLHRWSKPEPVQPPVRRPLHDEPIEQRTESLTAILERLDPPDARARHVIDRFRDSRGIPRPGG
jgi:hypothetical protein